MDAWTFIFLMLVLKIPIVLLLGIVWWAIHAEPDPAEDESGEGGSKRPRNPHPRGPLPRPARRGPHHADRRVPAPPRTRSVLNGTRDNHHA